MSDDRDESDDRTAGAILGGAAFALVDVVVNSAEILMGISSVVLPALTYLLGDLGAQLGIDQGAVTIAFVFFGLLFVLQQLIQAANKVTENVKD